MEEEGKSPKEKKDNTELSGKEVSKILNCEFRDVIKLIKEHGLPAEVVVHGYGYQIKLCDVEEFSRKNPELIQSLQIRKGGNMAPKTDNIPKDLLQERKREDKKIKGDPPPPDWSSFDVMLAAYFRAENDEANKKDPIKDQGLQKRDSTKREEEDEAEADKKRYYKNYISIRLTENGYSIADVSYALHLDPAIIKGWAKNGVILWADGDKDGLFIDPESLEDFFYKKMSTKLTPIEVKRIKRLCWPGPRRLTTKY